MDESSGWYQVGSGVGVSVGVWEGVEVAVDVSVGRAVSVTVVVGAGVGVPPQADKINTSRTLMKTGWRNTKAGNHKFFRT
jgi:hypothetical protein